jgi:AcrR family transcriptional regulator
MPDQIDSKEAILDAAETRFSTQGFDATTIKQIAGDAGVNTALIYYYFADKEALYGAMVVRLIAKIAATMSGALAGAATPVDAVREFAKQHNLFLEANPRTPKLIVRELVDYDAAHAQAAIGQLLAGTFDRLRGAIAAGQAAGIFRADLDPRFVAISLVSQTTYFNVARPAISILFANGGPVPKELGRQFAEHAATFTLAALAPVGTARSGGNT